MVGRDCLNDETIERLFRARLSPDELARMDLHIDRCPTCRALVSSLASNDDEASGTRTRVTDLASHIALELARERERALANGNGENEAVAAPPSTISERFEVSDRIGAGGMADVFRAIDKETGAAVALKVPRTRDSDDWARFEREAALLVELDHEGIVKHTAEGRASDGTPFLAMEWLDGEDLATRLRRGPLTIEQTSIVGARIAGALGAANAAGVVHRDVKPSNIFLRDGRASGATLIDFGIARRLMAASTHTSLTRTGMLLGTLGYMAPEQALGAKTADARADVFSLGCVLFECLTGRRAFEGAHAVEVLAKILTYDVPSVRTLVPEVPPALDALIARMLGRNAAARPANGDEVAAELVRIRTHGGHAPRDVRRIAAAAGVLLGALVGGAIVLFTLERVQAQPRLSESSPTTATATAAPANAPDAPLPSAAAVASDVPRAAAASTAAPVSVPPHRERTRPRATGAPTPSPAPAASVAPSTQATAPGPPADPFGSSRN